MKKYISLAILMELMDGKKHTASAMAFKFETSHKTIYRAIDILLQASVPIVSYPGRDGGFALINQKNLDFSFFTKNELTSFISFIKSNPSNLLSIDKLNFKQRLDSISNTKAFSDIKNESQKLIIDTEIWGSTISQDDKINLIKKSLSSSNKLQIEYNGKSKENRIIHPYTLVFKVGVWYIYAYCENRKDYRLFKLSKIKKLTILESKFERQVIDIESKPWNLDFKKNSENINMELICDKQVVSELSDWLGDNYEITNDYQNLVTIKTSALYSLGLIHRLMQFGDKILVLKPNKLREELKNECSKIINKYQNSAS